MKPNDPTTSELDRLFAAARADRLDTSRLEYGFEARLLARLRESSTPHWSDLFQKFSWRLMPLFGVATLTLAFLFQQISTEADEAQTLAYDDNTVPVLVLTDAP